MVLKECWESIKKCGKRGSKNLLKIFVEKFVGKLGKQIVWKIRWTNCVEHLVDKLDRKIWLENLSIKSFDNLSHQKVGKL